MSTLDFVGFSGHHPRHQPNNHHYSSHNPPPHNFNFIQRPGRRSILPYASYMTPHRVHPVAACPPPFQHNASTTTTLMDYSCRLPPVLRINDRWSYPKHSPPLPQHPQQHQQVDQHQQHLQPEHQHIQQQRHQHQQKQPQKQQHQQQLAKKQNDKSTRYDFTKEDIDAVLYGYATCGSDKSKVSHSLSGVSSRLTKGI